MESWSSTYRPQNMEITVRKTSGHQSMFVGQCCNQSGSTARRAWDIVPSKPTNKKSSMGSWWNDPEMKRKRRVAKYKLYSAEGKVRASVKNGFRWLKRKYSKIARH